MFLFKSFLIVVFKVYINCSIYTYNVNYQGLLHSIFSGKRKQEVKNRNIQTSVDSKSFYWAVGLSVVGCFLLVAALFMPPLAVIDPTVISAAGLLFTFSGAIVGINGNMNNKLMRYEIEMDKRFSNMRKPDESEVETEEQK
mgnify:CR=1 FL=1